MKLRKVKLRKVLGYSADILINSDADCADAFSKAESDFQLNFLDNAR